MPDGCGQKANFAASDYFSSSGPAEDLLWPSDTIHKTAALASNTVTEWLMSSPTPDHADRTDASVAAVGLRDGIAARILCHDAIRDDPGASARARQLTASGALIRTTTALIPAFMISDRRAAVILAAPDDCAAVSTWTRHPAVIATLTALFEQVWSSAIPLTTGQEPPAAAGVAGELRRIERQLLKLLADGVTDEVVARHLGVSLRTTRRHIAVLMNRLNAASRFQAGAEAAKKGWLL
jgi:DNA-binding CsgD family transcriptional regulator